MAYDYRRHRTVLFGGTTEEKISAGDNWLWDGVSWTEVAHFGPASCLGAAMIFNGDAVLLFGGVTGTQAAPAPQVLGSTWEWDGRHWTERQDMGPSPRWLHAIAYDSERQRVVLFGGVSAFAPDDDAALAARLLGDTWEAPTASTPATDSEMVIGKAAAVFPRDGSLERLGEAALGNLVADAMRERYGIQIGIITAGELRSPLPSNYQPSNHALHRPDAGYVQSAPFDLVAGDVVTILPFGNLVLTRQITGAQLWTILEHSVASEPAAFGGFAQVSGFRFTYQLSAAAGARLRSVRLDNGGDVAADAHTLLTVAISSFAGSGGDGYSMLADGQGIPQETIADMLLTYIQRRGTISASPTGRITQLP
jgi:5'-nucleotidase-like protein